MREIDAAALEHFAGTLSRAEALDAAIAGALTDQDLDAIRTARGVSVSARAEGEAGVRSSV